jgi:hypothetical protein
VVGLDDLSVRGERNGHFRVAREQLGHERLEVGREVLNDDERHARVGRHGSEKTLERFETARRCANPDDSKRRGIAPTVTVEPIVACFCHAYSFPTEGSVWAEYATSNLRAG